MSLLMSKDKKELIVTCNCGCGQSYWLRVDDEDLNYGYYFYSCYMKNNCDTEYYKNPWRAFRIKMKKIWFILRGKDYCYSDIVMNKEDFEEFKEYVNRF